MSVAEYPNRILSTGAVSANPLPAVYYARPPYYAVSYSQPYQDGGRDSNLDADTKTREFVLSYKVMTETEAAILDAHADSAKIDAKGESALEFNFYDKNTSTLYSNAHYLRYERPTHVLRRSQSREVVIIVRP